MMKILKILVYTITFILMCLLCSVDVDKSPFSNVMILGFVTVCFGVLTVKLLNHET